MGIKHQKRAVFFTIDALIAALIMIAGLLLITSSYISEQPRTLINHYSHDIVNVLSEIHIYELNNSFVDTLVANGSITNVNNTVMLQLGEFWADDELALAGQFFANVTDNMLHETLGLSINIDGETLFLRTNPVTNSLASSKKIISGIQKSKPIKGFISKARATSITKSTSMVVSFSPEGSGWDGDWGDEGFVYITKYFDVPADIQFGNITFYVSIHLEDDGNDWNVVNINNGSCNITRDDLNPTEEGVFSIISIDGCLSSGTNSVVVTGWNNGYNSHLHPGMYILAEYNVSEDITYLTSNKSERIYFDNVLSVEDDNDGSGAWSMLPLHIPPGATNVSATLHLNLQEVNDLSDRYWWWGTRYRDAWDFRVYVNSDTVFYQQDLGDSNDIDDCLYYSTACGTNYNWTGTFDISPELFTGTNVVSVYVNNYGDTVGGDGETLIYSNPINDPGNSSYVELNYSLTPSVPYGVVEIRQTSEFGGVPSPTKDASFSFPPEAVAISSVFTHVAEQYSYITRVYADDAFVPANMVFESPSSRAVPTDIYAPETLLDVSEFVTNYVRIRETSNNDVRPESTIDYGFYVPSFVGYGDVFSTVDAANSDAVSRLQTVMGSFVNVSDVVLDNTSMSDVPSMWGPAVIEVRVWN